MTDFETICPYTGLRSFSEDESLYFKGRDSQITRLIGQLEEKKFLMVTGASGDGKSSLIFAGLIPQARAGFFKAAHSNWNVVNFRPERSPLVNFAKSLADVFHMEDTATVETELRHGFSSLTEIYKSTSMFLDERDASFAGASEEARESMDREASNLLVVVDQFEEFFTNPENFPNDVPSQDSRLVLNILLETVKIALRDNLPIYVVFTMRSDYIGQCAAFSGLPEFIGFSQFFVPRLQRRELQQVIEEPAVLSGNRISKRLVDRLIADLEDIEDHLPILQHVLKEIWKTADSGREEMDLIHYAMVGGMAGDQLPKEQTERFMRWVNQLPEERKAYLATPQLSNVLDIHATQLYAEAATTYNRNHAEPITEKHARLVIAITFACLTRIDESRAVRNRMTLGEITGIINVPSLTPAVVSGVLGPFRHPDNTLIRPFIGEDGSNKELKSEAVLDITHEALIRNWKILDQWAKTEFEYYTTFLDFKKQLQRWIDRNKSKDFLLPVGPLTYFEKWFELCRPNAWWIKRYNSAEGTESEKLREAERTLALSKEFLQRSASALVITRTFMKYGAGRITAVIASAALIAFALVFGYRWWTSRNEAVVDRLLDNGHELLAFRGVNNSRTDFLITAERLQPGYIDQVLSKTSRPTDQLNVVTGVAATILGRDKYSPPPLFARALRQADSLSSTIKVPDLADVNAVNAYLLSNNDLLNIELSYLYFNRNTDVQSKFEEHIREASRFLYKLLTVGDPSTPWEKRPINITMTFTLNLHGLPKDSLSILMYAISPLEGNDEARKRFDAMFPASETIQFGAEDIPHNGGYDMLAAIYASLGNTDRALQAMDTVLKYRRVCDLISSNSRNILASFFINGHKEKAKAFVYGYAKRIGIPASVYMRGFVTQAGVFDVNQEARMIDHSYYNPNMALISGNNLEDVYALYATIIGDDISDKNEKNLALALMDKQHGAMLAKKSLEQLQPVDTAAVNSLFRKAVHRFATLPDAFLNGEIMVLVPEGNVLSESWMTRRSVFIYPDHINIYLSGFWAGTCRYYNDAFFKFIDQNGLLDKWYVPARDYFLLTQWVSTSFFLWDTPVPFSNINQVYQNYPPIDRDIIDKIDAMVEKAGVRDRVDNTWIPIIRMNDFIAKGSKEEALVELGHLNMDQATYGRRNFSETIPILNYTTGIAKKLLPLVGPEKILPFVYRFKSHERRIVAFSELGIAAYEAGMKDQANAFLDSTASEYKKIVTITDFAFRGYFDLRNPVVRLTTLVKGNAGRREILELTADMGDKKVPGFGVWIRTYASLGKYHQAELCIPSLSNANDKLSMYNSILSSEILSRPKSENDPWAEFDSAYVKLIEYTLYGQELL